MKTKYLLGAALVATAFSACTDDFLAEQDYSNQEFSTTLSEDFVLGVSLGDGVESRANWAGSTDEDGNYTSVFSNVYFSPAYASDALDLSNTSAIKGDQIGLSLVGSNKALTNIPFFIAGYESNARLAAGSTAPKQIFALKNASEGDLYYLGEPESDAKKTNLNYTTLVAQTPTALETAAGYVTDGTIATDNTNTFDVTKGLFKCHIPVMSGTYFAYFPFDKTILTQGDIKVPDLTAFATQAAANDKEYARSKMFAYSSAMQNFDHTKVSGQFSLDKNAAVIFQVKLQNYAETTPTDQPNVKLVTISAEGDDDAFVLGGAIGFDGTTAKFVEGAKTSGLMGVCLVNETGVQITADDEENTPAVAYIPAYVKSDASGAIVVRAYTTTGKVYERKLSANISSYKPGSNKAPIIKMNLAAIEATDAENLVYNSASFASALNAESEGVIDIKLMGDVVIDSEVFTSSNKKYNVSGGSIKFTNTPAVAPETTPTDVAMDELPAEITFECPVTIENASWTIASGKKVVFNGGVTNKSAMSVTTKGTVSATTFNNLAGSLIVSGVTGEGNAASFTATELNNTAAVTVGNYSAFNVTTINNKKVDSAIGTITVNNALAGTAYTINNNAGTTLNWGVEMPSALTLINAGTLNINGTVALNGANVSNAGTIALNTTSASATWNVKTGTLTNSGNINVITNSTNVATLNILSNATVTNSKNITDNGTMSGMTFITNSGADAKIIKVVTTGDGFVAANNKNGYTTIKVDASLSDLNVSTVNKDLILNNAIQFEAVDADGNAVQTVAKNITVNTNATLTTNIEGLKCSNIVIAPLNTTADVTLNVAANSVVKVTGTITTNKYTAGTPAITKKGNLSIAAGASVFATDIVTNGIDWTSYPEYGTIVE